MAGNWLIPVILCTCVLELIKGECLHEGKLYLNHTVWMPNQCTICTCHDPVSMCESVRCMNPECHFSQGEYLQIPSDDCCPECVHQLSPCQYKDNTISHNHIWNPELCSECFCYDGNVMCSAVTCPDLRCNPRKITQTLPGQCCPQCIPAGRPCSFDGEEYEDGSQWSPIPCTTCICKDGHSTCYPIQCPPLVCPQGKQISQHSGHCCPKCVGLSCTDGYTQIKDGEQWRRDACTYCVCVNGNSVCRTKECVKELECDKNERNITKDGECCPECILDEDGCLNEDPVRYSGDIWNISSCEFCLCQSGSVNCYTATCQHVKCAENEKKVHFDGKCCPECVEIVQCNFAGETYKDGDTWFPDPCTLCNCNHGDTECYHTSCPVCQDGSVSVVQPDQCCGTCQPSICSSECASCKADDTSYCTKCKMPGLFTEFGACVQMCKDGTFPAQDHHCQVCHESCGSCTGETRHHCTSCRPGSLWRDGECVQDCGDGFFQDNGQCLGCHPSCNMCFGPTEHQCLSCSNPGQVLLSGQCVDSCSNDYYIRDRVCKECQPTCRTCSSDGLSCRSCYSDSVLYKGQCLSDCPYRYYPYKGHCKECHPSCQTCLGPRETDCTSCVDGVRLSRRGRCRMPCPDGQFMKFDGTCRNCEFECSKCHISDDHDESVCTQCVDPSMVAFDSICIRECPIGRYPVNKICQRCGSGCLHCKSPTNCTRCGPSLYISDGICVRYCSVGKFIEPASKICTDCSENCLACSGREDCTQCNSRSYLKDGVCVSYCGHGYYQNDDTRQCDENRFPPRFEINGQIQIVEGGVTDIPVNIFSIVDRDTPVTDLLFILSQSPTNGQLVKTIRGKYVPLQSGNQFTFTELIDGKVRFIHNSSLETKGRVVLQVSDRLLSSEERVLTVQAVSKTPPRLLKNEPLTATSGETTTITTDIMDLQIASSTSNHIDILQGPLHGIVVHNKYHNKVSQFSLMDLRQNLIGYQNDPRSKAEKDFILMRISDGYYQLHFLIHINIRRKDDVLPMLVHNEIGSVANGNMLKLTPDLLMAKVMDKAPSSEVIYTLVPTVDNPEYGEVMMIVPTPINGAGRGWEDMGDGNMAAKMFRFMQRDINEGRIWYKHKGSLSSKSDHIRFEVADTAVPPNVLRDQTFEISVLHQTEISTPTIAPGVRLGMTILENQVVPISSANLAYVDVDTPDSKIIYTITSPFSDRDGTIEHVDNPFQSVNTFNQEDINNNRIVYRPPLQEIGFNEKDVSFTFKVSDGSLDRQPIEQRFNIRIIPVNNMPPRFLNPQPVLTLTQGGSVPLSGSLLAVADADTPEEELHVSMTTAPVHGSLEKNQDGSKIIVRQGDSFTYNELLSSTFVYRHDGSDSPLVDGIRLEVNDSTHKSSVMVDINIIKVDKRAPYMLPMSVCRVNVNEGESVTIQRNDLGFKDEDDSDDHLVMTLTSDLSHGKLLIGDKRVIRTGDTFTQSDINNGIISYMAYTEIGNQPVTESITFNISDSSGNVLPNQILSVVIEPNDNQSPVVTLGPALEVEEGGEVIISSKSLHIRDPDTPVADLIVVTQTLPSFGQVHTISSDKEGSQLVSARIVRSFPVQDVLDGNIYYIQNNHKNVEPVEDEFRFIVTDGTNESPVYSFTIHIKLINDEPPVMVTEQLLVKEDYSVPITNSSLYVIDLDTAPEDLLFTLDSLPQHGSIGRKRFRHDSPMMDVKVFTTGMTFTYQDVLDGVLMYTHGGGTSTMDSFTLTVGDGDFTDTGALNVVIGLMDDETPRLSINRGLQITSGTTIPIKSKDLRARDLDSNDSKLIYIIKRDPASGHLQLNRNGIKRKLSSNGAVTSFTQADIDSGYLEYVPGDISGVITFKFDVSDPEGNYLIDQIFYITIIVDRNPPKVISNNELVVSEGSHASLTTDHLSFTDVDSEPGILHYFLLSAPSLGHLEYTETPGIPISEFTQSDIAAGSVIYVHTSHNEVYMDRFTFTVTDGTNEVTQTFSIVITPVDDEIPVVVNNGLVVQEGVRKIITEFELKAHDRDTQEDAINFHIVNPPIHGSLDIRQGDSHVAVTTFTMADIFENKISYKHDGTETLKDNFLFTVTDGSNSMFAMQRDGVRGDIPQTEPSSFQIQILPVDDGSPVLEINLGLQFLEQTDQLASNIITSRDLLATDIDTPSQNIVFDVTRPPQHGVLENTASPNVAIQSFTQEDINNKIIRYVLTSDVDVLQDSFTFDLSDSKPNRISGNIFHIMWSVIEFELSALNVTETAGVIRVPVIRKGNQKQYSIVTCTTSPGTATSLTLGSRPGTQDYIHHTGQVQFDEWQDTKVCSIIINDDSLYEGPETFHLQLLHSTYALLGQRSKVAVTIYDLEDEPVIEFKSAVYHINETNRILSASLVRTGDVDSSVSVICYTVPLTAKGSSNTGLESGSDYISRARSNQNRVVFPQGSTTASCDIKLVDDSLFEPAEQFELVLSDPSLDAQLGPASRAVVIMDGPNDVSTIHFSLPKYNFDEDVGDVEIEILREGSDISHNSIVWCATRMTEPPSANPGQDYIPSSDQIVFEPGETSQTCRLTILDDEVDTKLEGNETFVVFLSSPTGSVLVQPYLSMVDIHDYHLDIPSMEFAEDHYTVDEEMGVINVTVVRNGDISYPSSVICYTRQNTAQVMMDYNERTLTETSRIFFQPGQKNGNCTVYIVNDDDYEPEEIFYLRLSSPVGDEEGCEANIGDLDITTITILNDEDVPTIQFEQAAYSVDEPASLQQVSMVTVYVMRTGDLKHVTSVRCSTRDGSAISGLDYSPKSQILVFEPGDEFKEFPIEILYNDELEWHEAFSIVLGPEDPEGTVLGPITSTTINILDDEASGSLVLPVPPVVVSLMYYDDVDIGLRRDPSPGYPLVCVSPCDIHYPEYSVTHSLCGELGINQSTLIYRWEVAMPTKDGGSRSTFVLVSDDTVYTSTDKMVLDSIYFRPSFQVRCTVQPRHKNGNPGIPTKSKVVKISQTGGICNAPIFGGLPNSYGAQSFLAKLSYVEPDDDEHPNMIHISIQIPHQDGHMPLISTYPLHNLRFVLSEPIYRQQHLCSNLILPEERNNIIDSGFLNNVKLFPPNHKFAYQYDPDVRGNKTMMLYKHLNIKSCMWTFDAWYHMTDLVDLCGGKVISDFQVKNAGQTYLTVRVPLYVYYVYRVAPKGWGSLQHHSEMEFSFYYNTVLWKSGIETDQDIIGDLQILKVVVNRYGKLIIDFKTQAKFQGVYVISHHTQPGYESHVLPPDGMAITFNLTQLWCQPTFDSPHQLWRATSNFNLKDYTGIYTFDMVPCTVRSIQAFPGQSNLPLPCTAQQPHRFEVPIAFQQSNRPVPLVYSLDTDFHLTNNKQMFLSRQTEQDNEFDIDTTFSEGEKVFGRVFWNPKQDLQEAYKLTIEKVYLCTGSDGYIPTYDPRGEEYKEGPQFGCIQPSPKLKHRFLILDRGDRDVEQKHFNSIPFNAVFVGDDPNYRDLDNVPGVDGFMMDVDPLYKVSSGLQWYVQVIYLIGKSGESRHRYRRKRSIDEHKMDGLQTIKEKTHFPKQNGTNIIHIRLNSTSFTDFNSSRNPNLWTTIIIPVISVIILGALSVIFIIICRRQRKKKTIQYSQKQSNIVLARQNSLQGQSSFSTKRLSQINVNVTEIKNVTIETNKDAKPCVKIKDINIRTQGKKNSGTEV